jgi:hypothetical protein
MMVEIMEFLSEAFPEDSECYVDPSPAPIEQEKKWDDKTDGEKLNEVCPIKEVICPACGGDGKETCHNPDHGFIKAIPGEISRLGCPGCGHDPNHKVNNGRNTCPLCGGLGHVIYEVADEYGRETGYDEEFIPYSPSALTSTAIDQPKDQGEVPEEIKQWILNLLDRYSIAEARAGIELGAIAMYHKMKVEIEDLKYSLMKKENAWIVSFNSSKRRGEKIQSLTTENTALQSKIEALERELEELKAIVAEKQAWINSHL